LRKAIRNDVTPDVFVSAKHGGEDTDVLKDIPRNNEQKPHRHCGKTLDEDASYLERTSKGFSWQSPMLRLLRSC
jgi:hypothetical protein